MELKKTRLSDAEEIALAQEITAECEPFEDLQSADLSGLLERIGDSKLVLLGESTHGTSEFYRMRARITEELIRKKGFSFVAAEADRPDAEKIDRYVRLRAPTTADFEAFSRFPEWMWRNREVQEFVHVLHELNSSRSAKQRVGFHGLDLYSLSASMNAVIHYLEQIDPKAAEAARDRYACLHPWKREPAEYGAAVLAGYQECEAGVIEALQDLLERRLENVQRSEDGENFFDALQNARVVKSAEEYYRMMYVGRVESWNLRDEHMFSTLEALLTYYGPQAKGVVWAHNSHLGDASATEKEFRNETNLGELCRKKFGTSTYIVGFGTNHGKVAAASSWGGAMEIKDIRPALPESHEHLCHRSSIPSFLLPLRHAPAEFRQALLESRLERAIGVIYVPETERASHYFYASLPQQFDEYIWFDKTSAVQPLDTKRTKGAPDTYPFGE